MATLNSELLNLLAEATMDAIEYRQLSATESDIETVVSIAYSKSFDNLTDWAQAEAEAKAAQVAEAVNEAVRAHFQQVMDDTHPTANTYTKGTSVALSDVDKISHVLTEHPLHKLAHQLDESGKGFDYSKCPESIDLETVPAEVLEEVNRRHGVNFYPHKHTTLDKTQHTLTYQKSATNSLVEEESGLHEQCHRADWISFQKGQTLGGSNIYANINNGAFLNGAGGEIDPALLTHIRTQHGNRYDFHAMDVPMVRPINVATLQEAGAGASWDYQKAIPLALITGAAAKVAQYAPRIAGVASRVAKWVGSGKAAETAKTAGNWINRGVDFMAKHGDHIKDIADRVGTVLDTIRTKEPEGSYQKASDASTVVDGFLSKVEDLVERLEKSHSITPQDADTFHKFFDMLEQHADESSPEGQEALQDNDDDEGEKDTPAPPAKTPPAPMAGDPAVPMQKSQEVASIVGSLEDEKQLAMPSATLSSSVRKVKNLDSFESLIGRDWNNINITK